MLRSINDRVGLYSDKSEFSTVPVVKADALLRDKYLPRKEILSEKEKAPKAEAPSALSFHPPVNQDYLTTLCGRTSSFFIPLPKSLKMGFLPLSRSSGSVISPTLPSCSNIKAKQSPKS